MPTNLIMDTNLQPVIQRGPRCKYRQPSMEVKRALVEMSLQPGISVARLAREHGVNANQVFSWRKLYRNKSAFILQLSLDLLENFGGSRAKRIGQFENDFQCRLIYPSLDETDEISFDPRRQSELLLCQPGIFPELTQHTSERN